MNEVKISVIVPIYNMEQYIEQCIRSIMNQSLKEIEIICINDGSTDSSLKIINELAYEDKRIRVVTQAKSGVATARNKGIDLASGNYLSILDADDYFEYDMLEKAYKRVKSCLADICIYRTKSDDGFRIQTMNTIRDEWIPNKGGFSPLEVNDRIFSIEPLWAWDKLFKRKLIMDNNIKFQNIRSTNDARFVSLALVNANKICICDDAFAIHRMNRVDALSVTRDKSWDCFYLAIESIAEMLTKDGKYDMYIQAFRNWILDFSIWNLHTINGNNKIKVYNLIKEIIMPKYHILDYPKEYYLFPYLYEIAYKIQEGNYLNELEEINLSMWNLYDQIVGYEKIVIYGAGKWGKAFKNKLLLENKNIDIKIVDKNWEYLTSNDNVVYEPAMIKFFDIDKIVIAVEYMDVVENIKEILYDMGIDESKIVSR